MNQKYVTIPSNDAADLDENLNLILNSSIKTYKNTSLTLHNQ